ncbi:MAG: MFS transporter [Acidimicrobiaceae bacterium]|nr:MFS transporter [Acidimicrobiaceae bacterium]
MQSPIRLSHFPRPTVKIGILLAIGYCDLSFISTTFLLPEIVEHYNISFGNASLIGTFQLFGFMVSTWAVGRFLQPRERYFMAALLVVAVSNLFSFGLPDYSLLIILRLINGLALGTIIWYGWVQAFGDARRMGDVAMAGPVVGVIAAPLISIPLEIGGLRLVFILLAALAPLPLVLGYQSAVRELPKKHSYNRAAPAARVLLACLGIFTLGGSSVFVYVVVLGTEGPEVSVTMIALLISLNAVAGIFAARWKTLRKIPGFWLAGTATCAFFTATTTRPWLYVVALIMWGFFYWLAIPGVFEVLASRSRYPEERVGDAQALMSAGRAVGPILGGLVLDNANGVVLGIVGGLLMLIAALGVFMTRTVSPKTWKTRRR